MASSVVQSLTSQQQQRFVYCCLRLTPLTSCFIVKSFPSVPRFPKALRFDERHYLVYSLNTA